MFARTNEQFNLDKLRQEIAELVSCFQTAVKGPGDTDMRPVLTHLEGISESIFEVEQLGAPANYIVRLRAEQSIVRRLIFRVSHIQRIQFVPSVHVLVQSLVFAIVILLLLLKTEGSPESSLIYM